MCRLNLEREGEIETQIILLLVLVKPRCVSHGDLEAKSGSIEIV